MKVRVKEGQTVNDGAVHGEGEVLDLPAGRARSLIEAGRVVAVSEKDDKPSK